MEIPAPTPIYHITHISHLASMIGIGGLHCNSFMKQNGMAYTNIAHSNIQDRRAITRVPCGPRGLLHDYVPFYFAPRCPMLCAIWYGRVEAYTEGQRPIIHLVSSVQAVEAGGWPFVFTDGHGTMVFTDFFEDLIYLDRIDWDVMHTRYWNDTLEDNDRKRRRQAEFLVHQFFPWELIAEIGVINTKIGKQVEEGLSLAVHKPLVTVQRGWYY
jgi:ssDNA thymidine ADP-ribosyltransferase, DarT